MSTPTLTTAQLERFWTKVDKTQGCWLWTSAISTTGYSFFNVGGRTFLGHRIMWQIFNGPLGSEDLIDHRCHVRACVNPAHLRLATPKQNSENLGVLHPGNKSGVRGVHWAKKEQKWRAQLGHNRKKYDLGFFASIEEATKAVVSERNKLYTHNDLDRQKVES